MCENRNGHLRGEKHAGAAARRGGRGARARPAPTAIWDNLAQIICVTSHLLRSRVSSQDSKVLLAHDSCVSSYKAKSLSKNPAHTCFSLPRPPPDPLLALSHPTPTIRRKLRTAPASHAPALRTLHSLQRRPPPAQQCDQVTAATSPPRAPSRPRPRPPAAARPLWTPGTATAALDVLLDPAG